MRRVATVFVILILTILILTSCASGERAFRGDAGANAGANAGAAHVWNLSPRADVGIPDSALNACCPRSGGDMRIDGLVDGQGRVRDVVITRPPATLGLAMGATCALFRAFVPLTYLEETYDQHDEDRQMLEECAEAERMFGGSYWPPPIPGTTRACVERMAGAWSLKDYRARPVSIEWKCRP